MDLMDVNKMSTKKIIWFALMYSIFTALSVGIIISIAQNKIALSIFSKYLCANLIISAIFFFMYKQLQKGISLISNIFIGTTYYTKIFNGLSYLLIITIFIFLIYIPIKFTQQILFQGIEL
jgi:hypothetical protein